MQVSWCWILGATMCFTLGTSCSNLTHPRLETNAVILRRLKYRRDRQRFPYLWWSLHRVRSALPAETPPDSRLGCWVAEYSWSSRWGIFHRIRISEYDLGSSLDRQGQFMECTRSQTNLRFLLCYTTGWRLHHQYRQGCWLVCRPHDVPRSPRQWKFDRCPQNAHRDFQNCLSTKYLAKLTTGFVFVNLGATSSVFSVIITTCRA